MASNIGAALVIGREWWPKRYGVAPFLIQKELLINLAKCGHRVYCTVLEASQKEVDDALQHNVHLILPKVHPKKRIPLVDALMLPCECFEHAKQCDPISQIFGYVSTTSGTADEAMSFQEELFPSADFVPFFHDIPAEMGLTSTALQVKEKDAFQYAKNSKTLLHLGPKVFEHYERKFIMLEDKTPLEYLPWLGEEFTNFHYHSSSVENRIEVLSLDGISSIDYLKEFDVAAIVMGKVVKYYKYDDVQLVWKLRGISGEFHAECKEYLERKGKAGHLSIVTHPPISSLEEIQTDLQQCHLLVAFCLKQDPFGMIGLMAIAAGIPTLIHKSTGIGTLIDKLFPLHNSIVCDIGPAESPEDASDKWEDKIMRSLKRYNVSCKQANSLKEELKKSAQDGVIAQSKRKFKEWCMSCLVKDPIKPTSSDAVVKDDSDPINPTTGKDFHQSLSTSLELTGKLGNGERDQDTGGDDYGSVSPEDVHAIRTSIMTDIGLIEILIEVIDVESTLQPSLSDNVASSQIHRQISDIIMREIKQPEDLPRVQELLAKLGRITIKLIKPGSLWVVLDCETSESLRNLWHEYVEGRLAKSFEDDILTEQRLQRFSVSTVSLRVTLPSRIYRRALLRLKYFKEGYQGNDELPKTCDACGVEVPHVSALSRPMTEIHDDTEEDKRADTTSTFDTVAIQLDKTLYKDDAMRHGLSKLLGSCQTVVTEPDEEAAAMTTTITMLLELKRSQQLSKLISEKPEILSALGIQRLLFLDNDQLSSVCVKDGDGYKYHHTDLSGLVMDKGTDIKQAVERKHLLRRPDVVTRSALSVLRLLSENEYLSILCYLWEDHSETHQMLKSRQMELDIPKNQLEGTMSAQSKREQLQPTETEISDSNSRIEESLETVSEASSAMVALQLDKTLYKDDAMRLGLSKLIGSCQMVVTEPDEEAAAMTTAITMLLELQRHQELSMVISEKPEILSALGIQRLLILDDDQLSSIRVRDGDGYEYSTNDLLNLMEDKAVDLPLKHQQLSSDVLIRSAPSMLRLLSRDEYLSVFSSFWREHRKTEMMFKRKQMEHDILQKEMEGMTSVVSQQDKSDDRIEEYCLRIKRENVSLRQQISDLENRGQGHQDLIKSDDLKTLDPMIEDFTFTLDIKSTKKSEREILMSLPCHFTWKLEEECDCPYKGLLGDYEETTYHPELSPTPHTAMMGYLQVSELRPPEQRDPVDALSWFDKALHGNQKELDSSDDKDGPLGDKLVILADKAWVYHTLGEVDKVREILHEIDQLGSDKLTEKQKAFVYGHKGTAFMYFVKKTCSEGLDSFKKALRVFPNKPDWLALQGFLQVNGNTRMYDTTDEKYTLSIKECKMSLKRVMEIDPNHSYARAILSLVLIDLNTDEAKYEIQEALRINPKSPLVLECAGVVCNMIEEFDKAVEYYDKAMEILPNNPNYHSDMGQVHTLKYERDVISDKQICSEDLVTANEYFNRAIHSADGVFVCVSCHIGNIQIYQEKYSEAIATCTSIIKISNDPYYKSLACSLTAKAYEGSLMDYSGSAIKFLEKTVEYGVEYMCGKNAAERVIEEMQKVLQSDPNNRDALVKIGDMYNKLNEFETAFQYYRQAIRSETTGEPVEIELD